MGGRAPSAAWCLHNWDLIPQPESSSRGTSKSHFDLIIIVQF